MVPDRNTYALLIWWSLGRYHQDDSQQIHWVASRHLETVLFCSTWYFWPRCASRNLYIHKHSLSTQPWAKMWLSAVIADKTTETQHCLAGGEDVGKWNLHSYWKTNPHYACLPEWCTLKAIKMFSEWTARAQTSNPDRCRGSKACHFIKLLNSYFL